MELKVGMYVRTKVGIFKIRKITKDLAYWKHEKRVIKLDRNIPEYNYRFSFYKDEKIFKGAKFKDNIIDLIKVGDYVNGCKITSIQEIEEPCYPKRLLFSEIDGGENNICIQVFNSKNIKSVATKEQFESIAYKVEKE